MWLIRIPYEASVSRRLSGIAAIRAVAEEVGTGRARGVGADTIPELCIVRIVTQRFVEVVRRRTLEADGGALSVVYRGRLAATVA